MRRPLLALAAAIAAIGLFAGGLAWLLNPHRPPPGAPRGERLYYALCIDCHGADGRGSWRALLFLRRPGDLADPERVRAYTNDYLFTIIKQGGDVLGRPGMPSFRELPDEDIRALVDYLRTLPGRARTGARATSPVAPLAHLAPWWEAGGRAPVGQAEWDPFVPNAVRSTASGRTGDGA